MATLTGTTNEVIDNTAAPGFIGFAQLPAVSVEATTNAVFETYNLATALPLTIGTPSRRAGCILYVGGQSGFHHHYSLELPGCAGADLVGVVRDSSFWAWCVPSPPQSVVKGLRQASMEVSGATSGYADDLRQYRGF